VDKLIEMQPSVVKTRLINPSVITGHDPADTKVNGEPSARQSYTVLTGRVFYGEMNLTW